MVTRLDRSTTEVWVEVLRALAMTLPFRAIVAFIILYGHLRAATTLAKDRFDYDWQVPTVAAPHFDRPDTDPTLAGWNRLIVSRWDSQHYMTLAMRGLEKCKSRVELAPNENPDDDKRCTLNFYPTYGWIGRYVARITGYAIDYAMLLVSVVSSFVFLMLWTSVAITRPLGVGPTYLALLLFNTFTFSFSLVTIQTEPLLLMFTLLAYWCFARRWLFLAALSAGAATSVRISGVGVGLAVGVGLLALTVEERPRVAVWVWRGALAALAFWGLAALMVYFHRRFGDAFAYMHAHEREYHHAASLESILQPDTRILMKSLWSEPFDGVIVAASLLWFALGHRKGLEWFRMPDQAFWYALFFGVMGVSMVGSADVGYLGMSRYALAAVPLFFAMAALLKRRPLVLAIWLYMSLAHYWSGSLCFYEGQQSPNRFGACGFARYFVAD